MTSRVPNHTSVLPLRPPAPRTAPGPAPREPLWRDLVGDVLRRERLAQERTLKDVADEARISMPYLSEVERGRKEASSEVLAAAAHALGLGLGDLLARAHGELVRVTTLRTPAARGVPASAPHGGLCLAA
ncbi:helix-turn-helix domain-containing protein [Streptomyces sp. enrichment culture]|uniref:helix-turn-helix domain-containing protein n=1 Tax=Streptomyces sp. enrichment culture TaxID=1795815 RepID=UPI003F570411